MSAPKLCQQMWRKALESTATMVLPAPILPMKGICLYPSFVSMLEESWFLDTLGKEGIALPLKGAVSRHEDDLFTEEMWFCVDALHKRVNQPNLKYTSSATLYGSGITQHALCPNRVVTAYVLALGLDAILKCTPEGSAHEETVPVVIPVPGRSLCIVSESVFLNYHVAWNQCPKASVELFSLIPTQSWGTFADPE